MTTTSDGRVVRYRPLDNDHDVLAEGLEQPYGVAISSRGGIFVAERGKGHVVSIESGRSTLLASGLHDPTGVALAPDGACLISELGRGRVMKVTASGTETILDGLQQPEGIAVRAGMLYVVDAGAHALVEFDLERRRRRTLALDLPVGAPPGVVPKLLRGTPPFSGPFAPFSGIAADPDGSLYFSADAEGSVMALRPS